MSFLFLAYLFVFSILEMQTTFADDNTHRIPAIYDEGQIGLTDHNNPPSRFDEETPYKEKEEYFKQLGNYIVEVGGGVAVGLPIQENPHVFLKTANLISCNALVITDGKYILLAHITARNIEKIVKNCFDSFKQIKHVNHNNIKANIYHVERYKDKEVLHKIIDIAKKEGINHINPVAVPQSQVIINIHTGEVVENDDWKTFNLALYLENEKKIEYKVQTKKNKVKQSNSNTSPNRDQEQEFYDTVGKEMALAFLHKINIKNPWVLKTF